MSAVKRIVNAAKPDDGDLDDDGGLAVAPAKPKLKRPPLYRVILLNDDYTPIGCVRHPSWMCIASAWTPGPRSPRAPTRAPWIDLSRLNPRSAILTGVGIHPDWPS